MENFDLFVIGAGSGGVRAARIAAGLGAKVAICEEDRVGGTCVLRGCVPKKLLVYASEGSKVGSIYSGYGWNMPPGKFSWESLIAAKDKELDRLNQAYISGLDKAGVKIISGRGILKGENTVEVAGAVYQAKHVLISVGGWPMIPDVPGSEYAITSNEALALEKLPKKIIIVGGGYIAVEFAGIFNGLGSQVDLVYRGEQILRGFDDEVRSHVSAAYSDSGVNVRLGQNVETIEKLPNGVGVKLSNGGSLEACQIMYATGRVPKTEGLGLDAVGVVTGERGEIVVDEYSRTSISSIFAVGDVTNRVNLTPVAIREGHAVARNLFEGTDINIDYSLIPTAVFSQPPIGTVGLSEEQARERFGEIEVFKANFKPMKYSLTEVSDRVFYKLIVDKASDKVVGCHLVGLDSAEIIQAAAIAFKMGATKADFDSVMAVHPTSAEELVTMK